MYNLRDISGCQVEEKKCKGMTKASLKGFDHWRYRDIIRKNELATLKMKLIRSYNHMLFNVTVEKLSFHSLNFSRVFVEENVSYPIGYYGLQDGELSSELM